MTQENKKSSPDATTRTLDPERPEWPEVERFALFAAESEDEAVSELRPDAHGAYVRFSDFEQAASIAQAERERADDLERRYGDAADREELMRRWEDEVKKRIARSAEVARLRGAGDAVIKASTAAIAAMGTANFPTYVAALEAALDRWAALTPETPQGEDTTIAPTQQMTQGEPHTQPSDTEGYGE